MYSGYVDPARNGGVSYVVKSQEKAFKFCPFFNLLIQQYSFSYSRLYYAMYQFGTIILKGIAIFIPSLKRPTPAPRLSFMVLYCFYFSIGSFFN